MWVLLAAAAVAAFLTGCRGYGGCNQRRDQLGRYRNDWKTGLEAWQGTREHRYWESVDPPVPRE